LLLFISGLIFVAFIVVHKRLQIQRDRNAVEMCSVVMLATAIYTTATLLGAALVLVSILAVAES